MKEVMKGRVFRWFRDKKVYEKMPSLSTPLNLVSVAAVIYARFSFYTKSKAPHSREKGYEAFLSSLGWHRRLIKVRQSGSQCVSHFDPFIICSDSNDERRSSQLDDAVLVRQR